MAKYRKKPVIVEAEQFLPPHNWPECVEPLIVYRGVSSALCEECHLRFSESEHGWICTREGLRIVCPGDWIITGVEGEKYPCKPRIFRKSYELVEEGESE